MLKFRKNQLALISISFLFTSCNGQEKLKNNCKLDISVSEINEKLTLKDIKFEDKVFYEAVLESNKIYGLHENTPIKYIDKIIVNDKTLGSTKDLQHFINLKKLILDNVNIT